MDHLTNRVKELEEELSRKEGRWNTTHNRLLSILQFRGWSTTHKWLYLYIQRKQLKIRKNLILHKLLRLKGRSEALEEECTQLRSQITQLEKQKLELWEKEVRTLNRYSLKASSDVDIMEFES